MIVYTDSIDCAGRVLPRTVGCWSSPTSSPDAGVDCLCEALYETHTVRQAVLDEPLLWKYLFIVESAPRSQYDVLIELSRKSSELPDGILCMAAAGRQFHGFKGRPWSALAGNIHLSAYLAPAPAVQDLGASFTVLAAVSVVDAIDRVPGLGDRAGIKWVNDILVSESKVGGVLAYTRNAGNSVSAAVLGIGLNVETRPPIEPTRFVPEVACLRDVSPVGPDCAQPAVFATLIDALDRNYRLLTCGGYHDLLDRYRRRSLAIGRHVTICAEHSDEHPEVIASGRAIGLGDNLELFLEGFEQPFSRGRLVLEDQC